MAKYDVTYKCGHEGKVDLWGPGRERERVLNGLGYKLCPDCYKAAKDAETAKANEGMAALTGSEKQVAWALDIRGNWVKSVDQRLAEYHAKAGWSAEDCDAKRNEIMDLANSVSEARWWIENRDALDKAVAAIRKARASA